MSAAPVAEFGSSNRWRNRARRSTRLKRRVRILRSGKEISARCRMGCQVTHTGFFGQCRLSRDAPVGNPESSMGRRPSQSGLAARTSTRNTYPARSLLYDCPLPTAAMPSGERLRNLGREDAMSGVRVLVGTRKGAFILTADGKRRSGILAAPISRVGRCITSRVHLLTPTGYTHRSAAAGLAR